MEEAPADAIKLGSTNSGRIETSSDYDREKARAKLAGGVAVIQVGAATETELGEKKPH